MGFTVNSRIEVYSNQRPPEADQPSAETVTSEQFTVKNWLLVTGYFFQKL